MEPEISRPARLLSNHGYSGATTLCCFRRKYPPGPPLISGPAESQGTHLDARQSATLSVDSSDLCEHPDVMRPRRSEHAQIRPKKRIRRVQTPSKGIPTQRARSTFSPSWSNAASRMLHFRNSILRCGRRAIRCSQSSYPTTLLFAVLVCMHGIPRLLDNTTHQQ